MKRAVILAVCLALLAVGSELWGAAAEQTSAGLCYVNTSEAWPRGASPHWVEYYAMHWDSLGGYQQGTPDYWDSKDSVRFYDVCYSEPICSPWELWIGPLSFYCAWYEKDTIMDGGNVGVAGDTLVSDCDTLIVSVQTSWDGQNWWNLLTFGNQDDTSTVYWYLPVDSLGDYMVGQFFRAKMEWIGWDDSISAKIDTADHLTDNKVLLHWSFGDGYKARPGLKNQ